MCIGLFIVNDGNVSKCIGGIENMARTIYDYKATGEAIVFVESRISIRCLVMLKA